MKHTPVIPDDSMAQDAQDGSLPDGSPWGDVGLGRPFHECDELSGVLKRALLYARVGIPIHFRGAAGQGKTTLAFELARRLNRPVSMMTGNDWLGAADMIGQQVGQTTNTVVDNYVQSVRRTKQQTRLDWEESILATAMREGRTLIYDEFTRASAAANGILLSVLEEGLLVSTDQANDKKYLKAHKHFRIILTSNPQEYAGVNATPDALMDRMITFDIGPFRPETEAQIVAQRTDVSEDLVLRIVKTIRAIRETQTSNDTSMRAALMISRVVRVTLRNEQIADDVLAQIIQDVLQGRGQDAPLSQISECLAQTQ